MKQEQKISMLVLIIVIGFISAVIFHFSRSEMGYPYNTFLFSADDRFNDFFNPLRGSFDRDPYNPERIGFIGGYLPFGYLVSFLFSLIRPWNLSFLFFILTFFAFLTWYVTKNIYGDKKLRYSERFNMGVLVTLTYPVLFLVDRANFDIVIFIFFALFVWFYQRKQITLATLLLAFPIAMKGYPLVLLTISLMDKRFREIVLSCTLVIFLEIISLAMFKDGLAIEFGKMLTSFATSASFAFTPTGGLMRFNSSLYMLLLFLKPSLYTTPWFFPGYILIMLAIFAAITTVMFMQKYPFWRKLLLVVLMMILFPQSSVDYRLIMFFPPLLIFLAQNEKTSSDKLITFLLAFLFIPKAYYIFYGDVNIGIVINPLLLTILLITVLTTSPRTYPHEELS